MSSLQPRPTVLPPGPWSFPVPEAFTLPNGLAVELYRRPGQYVISAGLCIDVPLTAEDRAREGVATLTAGALDQGTSPHPDVAFADAVESCGAVLEASAGYSSTQVYLDVPGSHLAEALPLLAEAVGQPELTDESVDRERGLRLAQIEQMLAQGSARADHAIRGCLVGHAFRSSRMKSGEPDTLAAVAGEDVRAFHAAHFGPRGATLVLVGDFTEDPARLVERSFGDWANQAQVPVHHEAPTGDDRRLLLVDRPGSVQADVRLGRFTIDRADPRWAAFSIAVHALGGAFLSRLNKVLREEKGYTYGVHVTNTPLRTGGFSAVHGSFRNDVVADAVSLLGPLLDVGDRPITEEEVERARTYLVGVQPLQFATASGVCNGVLALLGAGLRPRFIDDLRAAYDLVTPESATAAASELLPGQDLSLVVVGDAGALADGLRAAGYDATVEPATRD